MKPHRSQLDDKQMRRLVDDYLSGVPVADLARRFGKPSSSIIYLVKKMGISPRQVRKEQAISYAKF